MFAVTQHAESTAAVTQVFLVEAHQHFGVQQGAVNQRTRPLLDAALKLGPQPIIIAVALPLLPPPAASERADGEGEVAPRWRDDVALLPQQAQQQVLLVRGPTVDPGALQPGGDVTLLSHKHTQSRLIG